MPQHACHMLHIAILRGLLSPASHSPNWTYFAESLSTEAAVGAACLQTDKPWDGQLYFQPRFRERREQQRCMSSKALTTVSCLPFPSTCRAEETACEEGGSKNALLDVWIANSQGIFCSTRKSPTFSRHLVCLFFFFQWKYLLPV